MNMEINECLIYFFIDDMPDYELETFVHALSDFIYRRPYDDYLLFEDHIYIEQDTYLDIIYYKDIFSNYKKWKLLK